MANPPQAGTGTRDEVVDAVRDWGQGTGGSVLVVEGRVGAGKSRALARAAEAATALGAGVASRRACELDHVAPLVTLGTTLRGHPRLATAAAGLSALTDRRLELIERLGDRLAEATREHPCLIGIDDADLADELTALALNVLVPAVEGRVLWVLTTRPHGPRGGPVAAGVVRSLVDGGARHVALGALDDAAVDRLCVDVAGAPPDDALRAALDRAGGDPFLSAVVLRSACASGAVHARAGRAVIADGSAPLLARGLPAGVAEAVTWRLGRLSPLCRRAVEAGAVLGGQFSGPALAQALRSPVEEVMAAVAEAVDEGLLADDGAGLGFRHELMRDAVDAGIGRVARRALEPAAPAVPATPAPAAPSHSGVAIARRVRGLATDGQLPEARALAEEHLRGEDPDAEAEVLTALAPMLVRLGDHRAVTEYARRAAARPGVAPGDRTALLGVAAYGLVQCGDIAEGARLAASALDESAPAGLGAPEMRAWAATAAAIAALARGETEASVPLARRAVTAADHAGGAVPFHPRLVLAVALTACGRFTEADAVSRVCELHIHAQGPMFVRLWWAQLALRRVSEGDLDAAVEAVETATTDAPTPFDPAGETLIEPATALLALRIEIAVHRGDLTGAAELLARARTRDMRHDARPSLRLDLAEVRLEHARGRRDAAAAAARRVSAGLTDFPGLLFCSPGANPLLATVALDAGDDTLLAAVSAHADAMAARNAGLPVDRAAAEHVHGLRGHDADRLRRAAELYRGLPLAQARAHADAEALARRERTVPTVAEAVRALGRGSGSPASGGGDADPLEGLTAAERKVVELVSSGLTNKATARRLAVSRHTVDSHLRSSFAKLGVSSRVELARWYATRPAPAP